MPRLAAVTSLLALLVAGLPARARGPAPVAFVPDPSCRANKLADAVGAELLAGLQGRAVRPVKTPDAARILVQFFIIVRSRPEGAVVELEGRAFENASGKLLTQQVASAEASSDDEAGRLAAARQAARALALELSEALDQALANRGRGRRLVLQVTLAGAAAERAEEIRALLQRQPGLQLRGRTQNSLVFVMQARDPSAELAEKLGEQLQALPGLAPAWELVAETTLLLRLAPAETTGQPAQGRSIPNSR